MTALRAHFKLAKLLSASAFAIAVSFVDSVAIAGWYDPVDPNELSFAATNLNSKMNEIKERIQSDNINLVTVDMLLRFARQVGHENKVSYNDFPQWKNTKLGKFERFEDFQRAVVLPAAIKQYHDSGALNRPFEEAKKGLENLILWCKDSNFTQADYQKIDPTLRSAEDLESRVKYVYERQAIAMFNRAESDAKDNPGLVKASLEEMYANAKKAGVDIKKLVSPRVLEQLEKSPAAWGRSPASNPEAMRQKQMQKADSTEPSYRTTEVKRPEANNGLYGFLRDNNLAVRPVETIPFEMNRDRKYFSQKNWEQPNTQNDALMFNKMMNMSPRKECPGASHWQMEKRTEGASLGCVSIDAGGARTVEGSVIDFDRDAKGDVIRAASISTLDPETGNIKTVETVPADGKAPEVLFQRNFKVTDAPLSASTGSVSAQQSSANPFPSGNVIPIILSSSDSIEASDVIPALRDPNKYVEMNEVQKKSCEYPSLIKYSPKLEVAKVVPGSTQKSGRTFSVVEEEYKKGLKEPVSRVIGKVSADSAIEALSDPKGHQDWLTWVAQPFQREEVLRSAKVSAADLAKPLLYELTQKAAPKGCGGKWVKTSDPTKSWLRTDSAQLYVCLPTVVPNFSVRGQKWTDDQNRDYGQYFRVHFDKNNEPLFREVGHMDLGSGVPKTRSAFRMKNLDKPFIQQAHEKNVSSNGKTASLYNTTLDLCTNPEAIHKRLVAARGEIAVEVKTGNQKVTGVMALPNAAPAAKPAVRAIPAPAATH